MAEQQSAASRLSTRLEEVTDAYATKANKAAIAENEYLRAYAVAYAKAAADDVAVTIRSKHVDNQEAVVDAKCLWNLANAAEKSAKAKWEEVKSRLMAALSYQRFIREQT